MLVGERMTRNPITTGPDATISDALAMMRREKVRRLPVVGKKGRLLGIVSEKDLLYASPSPATSLSVWEINHLLSRLHVSDVMTSDVITVTEDVFLEDAARMMADNKIGALPVVRGDTLVGIITETDLFKLFIELFGVRDNRCPYDNVGAGGDRRIGQDHGRDRRARWEHHCAWHLSGRGPDQRSDHAQGGRGR